MYEAGYGGVTWDREDLAFLARVDSVDMRVGSQVFFFFFFSNGLIG